MESLNSSTGPNKLRSTGPTLFEPISSTSRVKTDPQGTAKRSHLPSLHHHTHRHHHTRHAKGTVQSAVQLHAPTSFGDLLKQASRSSHNSPSHSRRESIAVTTPDRNEDVYYKAAHAQKPVGPEDVSRERAMVKVREEELRAAMQKLSEQSFKTSRDLDDTYYSILEKVSSLRQTIASLQELCGLTKELHDTFESDTQELVEETRGQFEGFNDFETQQEQVTALEDRIKAGKQKADKLTAKLENTRRRVEARAKLEAEWEATTSRRLRILWGILGSIAGLMLVAILVHQLKPTSVPKKHLDFSSRDDILNAPIPEVAKEALMKTATTKSKSKSKSRKETPVSRAVKDIKDDDGLRIFDEL
ncbi:hypothetical protein K504DRAFT_471730 [Pleomassaria siparia CBS 279.74]|uniref:Uncharacterized protein n=1 Tax=Pleomassaria siparia CBS 279.74 TaxID=1314801 RepID=A0A6G1JXE6_9PLEO|nr:hypothetical protein K504DRAFT_471730 [Pleomassaria siparia CBS 279.74]